MKIGLVAGTIVSTINSPVFDYRRLLMCDLLDEQQSPTGDYTIAVDAVDAGVGDLVLILDEGNSARQIVGEAPAPIRAMVVGIIDEIAID